MSISKTLLVIAPHADDEVLGVGGTVNRFLREGNKVHLIICSKRKNDLPEYVDAVRHYSSIHELKFSDESLSGIRQHLLKSLERVYKQINPDVVFIPNKDDFNFDHKTVYEVCEIVTRRYQDTPPEMVLSYEIPSSTTQSFNNNFKCNYYVPLSRDDLTKKIGTFTYYKNELREYPNPRSSEGLLTYAKFRGMECNSEYAEGFKLIYQKI